MTRILIVFIKAYKWGLSPLFPPVCRFYPCCSAYAVESLQKYGWLKGGLMAVRRLVRCHPFSTGGYDPVA